MSALSTTAHFDRALLVRVADWLAVGVAVALPWSTTATGILVALWLIVVLPTLDAGAIKRELLTAAGGLPVLLWCLGVAGMLWAQVNWSERLQGVYSFDRLLVIPLLLAQFRRSAHGARVLYGFLASSASVLAVSFALVLIPALPWPPHVPGVPIHDDIIQSTEFLICAFAAIGAAGNQARKGHIATAAALIVLAALFLADIALVYTSRIALVVFPLLALLFGWRQRRWQGVGIAGLLIIAAAAASWAASPSLRFRLQHSILEVRQYRATDQPTDIGAHVAFLKESMTIFASAPIVGHGTGSIPEQFRQITAGKTGAAAVPTVNPHDQTFAVGIQLGLVGVIVLWAMWIAHFSLFRGPSVAAWLGTVVVVENIVSSTAHTHLFDFAHGWLYVFGVGVLGGMTLRERDSTA